MAVRIENLEIEIKASARGAVPAIERLTNALKSMQSVTKNAMGLGKVANQMKKFSESLKSMDFAILSSNVSTLGKEFDKIGAKIRALDGKKLANLNGVIKTLVASTNNASTKTVVKKALEEINAESKEAEKNLQKLNDEAERTTKLGTFGKMLMKGGGGFLKSIGRIALYRAIRSALKAVTTAVKEGTGNLYQYGKAMNSTFVQSLDSAATSIQYLKNGLAVGIAPAIQAITPAIVSMSDALAEFGNKISEVYANNQGEKYFTKAVKSFKEYQEAVEAAKSTTLGFDELNIIDNKNPMAGMFEEAAVDSERAKENSWGIAGALSSIAAVGAGSGALKILFELSKAGVLEATSSSILALGSALGITAGSMVLFATKGKDIKVMLKEIINGIDKWLSKSSDSIPILKGFAFDVVAVLEFPFQQLALFADSIQKLFEGDWEGLGENVVNILLNTVNLLVRLLNGALFASVGAMEKIINLGIKGINGLVKALDGALGGLGIDWFKDLKIPEVDWVSNWEVPQMSFSSENGFGIRWTPLGSNAAGKRAGDNLFSDGSMNGVPGELGYNGSAAAGWTPQIPEIKLYLDGKQILNSVQKAQVLRGNVLVESGLQYQ